MSKFTCIYYERAMPPEFCDYILECLNWDDCANGTVHNDAGPVINEIQRQTDILSEHLMSPLGSVCKNYLVDANGQAQWADSLCGFDIVQVLRYTVGGHYKWHHDVLPPQDNMIRAASFILLLNDPSEFEGGQLQLKDKSDNLLKNKGDIVVFDSLAYHRVTPVTKGTRYSVACWAKTACE